MQHNLGKYNLPPTLQILMDFEKELGDCEHFYDGLHFYLSPSDFRYFNTPSDVIVFGHIGADGIHYGFLTDYGSITDLEEAPIVCICPMDFEQPTRIIANNLREFLRINFTNESLFYNDFATEDSYLAFKEEQAATYPLSERQLTNLEHIKGFLEENVQIPIIEQPYRYIQTLRLQQRVDQRLNSENMKE